MARFGYHHELGLSTGCLYSLNEGFIFFAKRVSIANLINVGKRT
jgi:hypothetical protein